MDNVTLMLGNSRTAACQGIYTPFTPVLPTHLFYGFNLLYAMSLFSFMLLVKLMKLIIFLFVFGEFSV